ncbi:START domain-containing protein [Elusimicrobiota bacterium]
MRMVIFASCWLFAFAPEAGAASQDQALQRAYFGLVEAVSPGGTLRGHGGVPKAFSGADWELKSKTPGMAVYTRARAGSDIREVKATGAMDAPPAAVWKVVGDYEHYADFMPYIKECRTVSKEGDRVFYVYQRLDMPLIADRDFTIKITWAPETADGVYRASWVSANEQGPAAKEGVERIQINEGSWSIEPLDNGKRSAVTYRLFTDPGDSIPTWLANKGNTSALPELFRKIGKRASAGR